MSDDPIEQGGCLCGAVRFELPRSGVVTANNCHCRDCQRSTGSGFATICMVPDAAFTLLSGEPRSYEVTGEGGGKVDRSFCGDCGSPLFSRVTAAPGLTFVKAAVFDDPSWIEVAGSWWSRSAQPWAPVDDSKPVTEGNPG
ncbi:MAG: GFA family protein [Myxococcota bacterium]|nr:GFA family protein [Myxococcota bacterium]